MDLAALSRREVLHFFELGFFRLCRWLVRRRLPDRNGTDDCCLDEDDGREKPDDPMECPWGCTGALQFFLDIHRHLSYRAWISGHNCAAIGRNAFQKKRPRSFNRKAYGWGRGYFFDEWPVVDAAKVVIVVREGL